MNRIIFFFFFLVSILSATYSYAQTDSTATDSTDEEETTTKILDKHPRNATLMSALLPGLGQIYNKKYWKAPIIYALGGVVTYFFISSEKNYRIQTDSVNSYNTRNTVNGVPPSFNPFENNQDFYHKNRDLSAILIIALYTLNIIDAHVDGHLRGFDIDEKLSLRFKPLFYTNYNSQFVTGLTANFVFK